MQQQDDVAYSPAQSELVPLEDAAPRNVLFLLRPVRSLAVTFRSLRHRNYRLYFVGQLVSLIGTWMQTTAVTWLAFEITEESYLPAVVNAVQIVPTFLFGAWGGIIADRLPKRTVIFCTQAGFLAQALLLAFWVFQGSIQPWQLVAVSLAAGLLQAIDLPVRLAFVMDLAGREDLMNAVALNSLLFNMARIVGPALGGILLAWKPWTCFLANALSYVAVLFALYLMTVSGQPHQPNKERPLESLVRGFSYVLRRRDLAFLLVLVATTSICGWPVTALLPALSHSLGKGAEGYSRMLSAMGIGALVGAWAVATFGSERRRSRFVASGVMLVTLGLIGLSGCNDILPALLCCGLVGSGLIFFMSTSQSILQLSAADEYRARIMGIYAMVFSGAVPLGNMLFGPSADRWGVSVVLLLQGAACTLAAGVVATLFLWRGKLHTEVRPPPVHSE